MRFYKAPNKRLIARGRNGRFRNTTLQDVGLWRCEKCGLVFAPDYSGLVSIPDPRIMRTLQRICPECKRVTP